MSLLGKRIPQLDPKELLSTNGLFAWYDPATDQTYRISAAALLGGTPVNPGQAWTPDYSYAAGDIATYNGQIWISAVNDNLGNPPGPSSLFWDLEPDTVPDPTEGYVVLDTSGAAVSVDMSNARERRFIGSDPIAGDKDWSFSNILNAIEIPSLIVQISAVAAAQTFGAGFKMSGSNDWDSGSGIWAPLEPGEYELRFTRQGGLWRINVNGPFY